MISEAATQKGKESPNDEALPFTNIVEVAITRNACDCS